jgi:hypothetical protein
MDDSDRSIGGPGDRDFEDRSIGGPGDRDFEDRSIGGPGDRDFAWGAGVLALLALLSIILAIVS